jgi:hypothetical protein
VPRTRSSPRWRAPGRETARAIEFAKAEAPRKSCYAFERIVVGCQQQQVYFRAATSTSRVKLLASVLAALFVLHSAPQLIGPIRSLGVKAAF